MKTLNLLKIWISSIKSSQGNQEKAQGEAFAMHGCENSAVKSWEKSESEYETHRLHGRSLRHE